MKKNKKEQEAFAPNSSVEWKMQYNELRPMRHG